MGNQQGGSTPRLNPSTTRQPVAAAATASTSRPSPVKSDRLRFHKNIGGNISLYNGGRTIERALPDDTYNMGVAITDRPLKAGELFQFRIEKRVSKWQGNMELGITTEDPDTFKLPETMTHAIDPNGREATIIWDGSMIESHELKEHVYGNLNASHFQEGAIIGMMRTANKELHFYQNGKDLGVAATNVSTKSRGLLDLYGNVCKVTIVDAGKSLLYPVMKNIGTTADSKLLFHSRTGQNAEILNNNKTARRTTDDFHKGTLMTNRLLRSGEMFEVTIEKTIPHWSGAVELGVTLHRPETLDHPTTLTELMDKTWCLSGANFLINGAMAVEDYGSNLDALGIGDKAGLMVNNGSLRYYINGVDQGVVCSKIPAAVYGIVDMYGSTAQISIVEGSTTATSKSKSVTSPTKRQASSTFDIGFHSRCGNHVSVYNNNRTAKRDAAKFNYGIVLSSRTLEPNERFEVELQDMAWSWSGALEIGVTTFDPNDQTNQLPSTMSLMEDGTWMLVGESVMHKLQAVKENYHRGTGALQLHDKLGVQVKDNGDLHFYQNGRDLGCAAKNVPSDVYCVVDLYGRASQVSVVDRMIAPGPSKADSSPSQESVSFTTVEGIDVTMKAGNLVEEMTDVIVNTTGKNMVLDAGAISKAVLKAAGPQIQVEVNTKAPKGVSFSQVIQSSGGNLSQKTGLKAIYHGSVAGYDGGKGQKTLENFISNTFSLAHKNNMTSIALPAIGSGILGYPPELVAQIMVEQITKFSQSYASSTKLKDIRVVLYSQDQTTILGFKSYLSGSSDVQSSDTTTEHSRTFQIGTPDTWTKMSANQQCELVDLASSSKEYKDVHDRFLDTGGPKTIIKIERIQSPNMYMLYSTQKRCVECRFDKQKYRVAERILYHGTDHKVIDSINKNGFNRVYCGKNAVRFGEGVYFAVQASYSSCRTYSPADPKGVRHIYHCRVLTGEYAVGNSGIKQPPAKDPSTPNELYHTAVDDEISPTMFVTFHDANAYPEYLISFT